jgi:hypothetical protein
MILSLWFWSRKIAGRRTLISVSGVFPLLLFLMLIILGLILPILQRLR